MILFSLFIFFFYKFIFKGPAETKFPPIVLVIGIIHR